MALTLLVAGCAPPQKTEELPALSQIDTTDLSKVSLNPLRLEDAVRFGVLNASSVLTSGFAFEQSENSAVIARAALFPELFFRIAPSDDDDLLSIGSAGIRYTLYDFGERAALLAASQAGVRQARYEVLSEIDETVLTTVSHYIDLAINLDQVGSARNYLAAVNRLENRVRARVEIGVASSVDLNEIETGRNDATAEIIDAEANETDAREALASFIGLRPKSISPRRTILSKLKSDPTPSSAQTDLQQYPKVAALREEVDASRHRLDAAKAGLLPRLGLRIGVGLEVKESGAFNGTGVVAGPEIANTVSLGGGRKERVRNAELDVLSAQKRLEEEIRLLRLEQVQADSRAQASLSRLAKRQEILRLTKDTQVVMLSEYELGTRSLRDLVQSETDIFEAQSKLHEAHRDLLKDKLKVLMARNKVSRQLYTQPNQ